jgi:hypothetical protein
MAVYNDTAFVNGILARHMSSPSSFTVKLYAEHWTLNHAQSKFLYNNPVAVSLVRLIVRDRAVLSLHTTVLTRRYPGPEATSRLYGHVRVFKTTILRRSAEGTPLTLHRSGTDVLY